MNAKLISICFVFAFGILNDGRAQLILLDQFDPNVGSLVSLAFDATQDRVWTYSSFATNLNSYTRAGLFLGSIARPGEASNDVDIEIANEAFMLNGVLVPAGTLLFINGETGTADIYAVDPDTGMIITNLVTAFGNNHVVGGAWHPGRGALFLVADVNDTSPSTIAEIDPNTGAVITNFPAGFNVNFGDIAVSRVTSNLLVVSNVQTTIRELTPDGVFVRSLTLPTGVTSISGIGVDDARNEYFLSGTGGDVFRVGFAAPPVCSLAPPLSTNNVGQSHSVTVTVTTNGVPIAGLNVSFSVSGAHTIAATNVTTAGNGQATFNYDGVNTGTDTILAAGGLGLDEFSCDATKVWIDSSDVPQITCPGNVTTNTAAGTCARSVSFTATATGTPTPVITYQTNGLAVTSPVTFPRGITTVSCTASNAAGVDQCPFTVTVNDQQLPGITCSTDIVTNVPAAVTNAVVFFQSPIINENCSFIGATGCSATSGDTFPLGTTPVTCFAVDGSGNTNTCTFNVTVTAATPCTITCPADIVTNTALGVCGATVTFNVGSSGSCAAIVATPASGSFFNKGTNTVTVTTNGLTACTFNITVNDNEPPSLTCPANIITNVPAGVTNAIVNFTLASADDNCSGGALIINPPSGTAFPLGTNTVVVSMSDAAGNTNGCSFKVIVQELPPETHDLALIKLKAPKNINLQGAEPSLTKFVKVTLQNRSPHDEVITNFNGLVTLVAQSLSNVCPNAQVVLHPGPPNNPKTLKPKQKMTVTFDVTWTCANDPLKGEGHEDFRYLATVHHEAIDGQPDTHPEDDGCPRAALPGGTDSNPDPSKPLKDTGCAGGVDVKTDVFLKQ